MSAGGGGIRPSLGCQCTRFRGFGYRVQECGGLAANRREVLAWFGIEGRPLLRCFAVVLSWILLSSEAYSQPLKPESVFIQAERLEKRGDLTIASGNVSVEFEGLRLNCQQLVYDPVRGLVTAQKQCLFSWGPNFAASETLVLNVNSKTATLTQAAGKSEGVAMGGKAFEGSFYFWADTLFYSEEKVELEQAILTTCDVEPNDLHYQIDSELVTLYPQDKIVAKNTSFTIHNKKLYTLPTVVFPLDEQRSQRQAYFPTVGYNSLDGAFLRNAFNYSFDERNYGTISLDLYQRSGIGFGLEHFFDFGEIGAGNIYYYTQNGQQAERNRFELRANGNFKIDEYTRLGLSYNSNQFELPGEVSPLNVSSAISVSRNTGKSALQVGANFSKSGEHDNTSYRFYYDLELSDRWSLLTRADLSRSSNNVTQTNRYHYLGSLRHRGDLFEGDLSYERSGGQQTYFLNRQPELSLRAYPFKLGFLPITVGTSFGILEESPSLFKTERYRFDLRIPDQFIETGLGNFHFGGGLKQSLYGSGQQQYVLGSRVGWTNDIADHLVMRFDYNWQNSDGYTPFQHDLAYDYQVVSGGLEVYSNDFFRLSATGAYDINNKQPYDIITQLNVTPSPGWELTASANLDPNTGTWRSVDSGVKAKLTPGVSLTHWSLYDLKNGRMTYQNFSLNYEDHDWVGSLTYRGVQNEVFFQMSLKAFPLRPVKIGPDSGLPILPVNLNNAFTR